MNLSPRCTPEETEQERDDLRQSKCAILYEDKIHFIKADGTQEIVESFEIRILLAHCLGVCIDWDATY